MKKLFLPFIALVLLLGGGQGIYTSMQNKEATEYSLNDLNGSNMPSEEWLRIKNCDLNLTEATYFVSTFGDGLAEEIYVPLRPRNQDSIIGLVKFKEKQYVDVVNIIHNQKDAQRLNEKMEKYKEYIFMKDKVVDGVVQFGINLPSKEWRQLAQSNRKLVDDFIIIEQGTEPSAGFSYFMSGLGVFLGFISIGSFRKNKEEEE